MLKYLVYIGVLLCISFAVAEEQLVTGKHAENEISCIDCHETDTPEKRANQRVCIDCHGNMSDANGIYQLADQNGSIHESAIHASHAGQLRCTLCHASHKPSVLYCNEGCHHTFTIQVP